MAEITHLRHGERPTISSLPRESVVLEWKPEGERNCSRIPGVARWHQIPDEEFDEAVASANRMAARVGSKYVFVIGRPE